jgi:GNAT superfamily N-acetyltransferase
MSGTQIGPARKGDWPAVLKLIRELAAFEKLAGPDAAGARRLRSDFAKGRFGLIVARRAGKVVAYGFYFFNYSSFAARPSLYLEDIYVQPGARRQGIATRMMACLAALAYRKGCGRMEWTVLDWNRKAQAFYRRLGAKVLPDWRICRMDRKSLKTLSGAAKRFRAF